MPHPYRSPLLLIHILPLATLFESLSHTALRPSSAVLRDSMAFHSLRVPFIGRALAVSPVTSFVVSCLIFTSGVSAPLPGVSALGLGDVTLSFRRILATRRAHPGWCFAAPQAKCPLPSPFPSSRHRGSRVSLSSLFFFFLFFFSLVYGDFNAARELALGGGFSQPALLAAHKS